MLASFSCFQAFQFKYPNSCPRNQHRIILYASRWGYTGQGSYRYIGQTKIAT